MPETNIPDRLKAIANEIIIRDGKEKVPTIHPDQNKAEWDAWRSWRLTNGLGVGFMDDCRKRERRFTVIDRYPPSDLEAFARDIHKKRAA